MSLRVACSRGTNAMSDGAVYLLTHSSPWKATQKAADSIARLGFPRCRSDLSWQIRCLRMVWVMGWRWSGRCLLDLVAPRFTSVSKELSLQGSVNPFSR